MAGITNNVNTKENRVPPTMTTPIPIRLVEAAPSDKAIGQAPNEIAKLVINIGRSRACAASKMASNFGLPCSRN